MDNLHIDLLRQLVSFGSVTPASVASMVFCQNLLKQWGFDTHIHQSGVVPNLVAYLQRGHRTLCVAGHLDVVDPGNNWDYNPFELTEHNGKLYGRGTNDMKGPLASALIAIKDFIQKPSNLSIMVLLTGDEEVMTDDGMKSLMSHVYQHHKSFYLGIIPESCSPGMAGEYIKMGCRGSMNVDVTSTYPQGHVANTSFNHLHHFINTVHKLVNFHIDAGNEVFNPSILQLTSIDVGNSTRNIVPSNISAKFNIRFNNVRTSDQIKSTIDKLIPGNIDREINVLSEPFIGCSLDWVEKLKIIMEYSLLDYSAIGTSNYCNKNYCNKITNAEVTTRVFDNSKMKLKIPKITFGTFGGNSDAKTLHNYMNVVEIGSSLAQAHISNEFITIYDINKLRHLYYDLLVGISAQDG